MDQNKNINNQLFSEQITNLNKKSFESFGVYKKTMGIIERANIAMGRKVAYTTTPNSTLNGNLNTNDISSTTKI
jgi:hypothetical protein